MILILNLPILDNSIDIFLVAVALSSRYYLSLVLVSVSVSLRLSSVPLQLLQ